MRKLRILLTGGGTGGHIYPLVAVSQKIFEITKKNNLEAEVRFVGAPGSYRTVLEGYGIRVSKIAPSKIRRYFSILNLLEPFKLAIGLLQALIKLYFYMPNVIFSKGGPGALPVVLAGTFYRIPIVIHESDAVPSLTTKISARFAKSIGVAFDSAQDFFPGKNVAVVGLPIREELLSNWDDQKIAKRYWGFNPERLLILVLGGSQGAAAIDDFIISQAPEILESYQILHQTGIDNFEEAAAELKFIAAEVGEEAKRGYKMVSYFKKDIKEAYLAADLVVSRAGSTIHEIAAFGKPAILVPLPEAAGDHQRFNAYQFAEAGAGVVIEQNNLLGNVFMVQLKKILDNDERRAEIAEASKEFFKPKADQVIAEEVLRVAIGRK